MTSWSPYDISTSILNLGRFQDNEVTHFASSFGAGTCATLLSQPIDVFKTRLMNAKPGEFNSLGALIKFTAQSGIKGFYKGFIPGTRALFVRVCVACLCVSVCVCLCVCVCVCVCF